MDTSESAVNRPAWAGGMRWLMWASGLFSVIAGIIVIAEPAIGLVTLAVVSGIFLVVDGIVETVALFVTRQAVRPLALLVGIISVLVGIVLIRHPTHAVVAVALILGLWLLVSGSVRLLSAIEDPEHRAWRVAGAIVEGIAGIVIVSSPGIGVATLAVLAGLAFILRGLALGAIGWVAGRPDAGSRAAPHRSVTAT